MKRKKFDFEIEKDKELSKKLQDSLFKQQETKYLKTFLHSLGYDLNDRWIYYLVNYNGDVLCLSTDKNRSFKTKKWDYKNKKYENYIDYFTDENLITHFYPYETKRKFTKKIKPECTFYSKKEKINMHMIDKCMLGSALKEKSNVLQLDIDCHDGNSLKTYQEYISFIDYIKKIDEKSILYIETSTEGSYHVYIKLDRSYTYEEKKEWVDNYKENNKCTLIDHHSAMRFPNSALYSPIDVCGEYLTFEKSRNNAVRRSSNRYPGFILKEESKLKNNIIEFPKRVIGETKVRSSIFTRSIRSDKINLVTPESFILDNLNSIYRNNRHFKMLEVVRIGKFNDWSINDIIKVIYSINDKTNYSKDLKKWSLEKLEKNVENIYKKSKIIPFNKYGGIKTNSPNAFMSNIQHLPQHNISLLESNIFLNHIIGECNYKNSDLNRTKFSIILKEMFGYIYYNTINEKKVTEKHTYKHLVGIQYPENFALKMKSHYTELKTTDVFGIINVVLKKSGLFKQYYINNRGWQFNTLNKDKNYCRQFDFKYNNNHILLNTSNIINYCMAMFVKLTINKLLSIQKIFTYYINNLLGWDDYKECCFLNSS